MTCNLLSKIPYCIGASLVEELISSIMREVVGLKIAVNRQVIAGLTWGTSWSSGTLNSVTLFMSEGKCHFCHFECGNKSPLSHWIPWTTLEWGLKMDVMRWGCTLEEMPAKAKNVTDFIIGQMHSNSAHLRCQCLQSISPTQAASIALALFSCKGANAKQGRAGWG